MSSQPLAGRLCFETHGSCGYPASCGSTSSLMRVGGVAYDLEQVMVLTTAARLPVMRRATMEVDCMVDGAEGRFGCGRDILADKL